MLIECPYCNSRVFSKVHGQRQYVDPDEAPYEECVAVVECPSCSNTLVGWLHDYEVAFSQDEPPFLSPAATRLWPQPERSIDLSIPKIVRNSLEEANRCFQGGAYSACAVMSARAVEGICAYHETQGKNLCRNLIELRDREIIDKHLYTWGDELRKMRNLGAHATEEKISKSDAQDVLDFANAITQYVFVLNRRFENFRKRRMQSAKSD